MSCVRHYRYPSTCRTRSGRRGMDGALTPFSCLVRHRAVFRPAFFQVVRLETVFETVRRDPHCNGSRFTSASARFRLSMCSKNVGLAHFDELRPRFPKKAEAKPQVVFGGLLGIWHPGGSGVPNRRFCCTQALRNRASARLDREPAHRLGSAALPCARA